MSALFWLVLVLAVVAQVSVLFYVRPALALGVAFTVGVASSFLPPSSGMSVASITVTPADVVTLALLGAVAIAMATGRFSAPPTRMWWVLVALASLAALRGIPLHGIQESGNAVRSYLQFFSVALFFASITDVPSLVGVMERWWVVASWALVGLAVVFWFHNGFAPPAEARALSSPAALVLAQATTMGLVRERTASLARFLLPAAGLLTLVLVQQRTVWVVTVVSLAAIASRRTWLLGASVRRARLLLGVAVVGLALLVVAGPSDLGQSLDTAVREPVGEDSTFAWRLDGWRQLLGRRLSVPAVDLVVGDPAGTGFERRIGTTVTEVSAHNYYVAVLTSLGLAGLVALILGYKTLVTRLSAITRHTGRHVDEATMLWVLVLGQLTYFIGYQTTLEQGIIAGLASGMAWHGRPQEPPVNEVERARQL